MPIDYQQKSTQANIYKPDAGGATLINEPVIGVVKNNIDPAKSGRIQVYIAKNGGTNPDDSNNWIPVSYMSPFSGLTGISGTPGTGASADGYGSYMKNPHSYGFWASAPDIGTEVICIFINGDIQNGFYIGCIPKAGMLAMTPAIGSTTNVVPNSAEAKSYGGADRLPTTEVNMNNPAIAESLTVGKDPAPVHSYQASILFNQGLIRDNSRGVISSSAQRESPSRVFGFSTPGGPIYSGGYTNSTIGQASQTAGDSKLQVTGRTGGHTFVMDDGGLQGEDQLMRMRSSTGHTIIMNDSDQTLFVIHANGQSWVELGKEGTIDMYATNSVNIRTEGDLNLHANRDVNIHADNTMRLYSKNLMVESDNNITVRSGTDYSQQVLGQYTVKVTGDLSLETSGAASMAASGIAYVNGDKVNLNTGSTGTTPADVASMPKTNHPDTAYSSSKGWMYPSPDALLSVTSRAPAHMPWIGSGKGVDVKISSTVDSSAPTTTSTLDTVNGSVPNVPAKSTTPTVNSTVPQQKANNPLSGMNDAAVTALAGQQAVTNSTMPSGAPAGRAVAGTTVTGQQPTVAAVPPQIGNRLGDQQQSSIFVPGASFIAPPGTQRGDGIFTGPAGLTITQATAPGSIIMPGSQNSVATNIAQGMPYAVATQGLVTGNFGAQTVTQALTSAQVQTQVAGASINQAVTGLYNTGLFTGNESAGQAGGVVLAAATYGTGPVTSALANIQSAGSSILNSAQGVLGAVAGTAQNLSNIGSNVTGAVQGAVQAPITAGLSAINNIAGSVTGTINNATQLASSIGNAISGGKLAGTLSDGIGSGLSGLANSVSGAIGGAISGVVNGVTGAISGVVNGVTGAINGIATSVASLTASLTGSLRQAFMTIEASYKALQSDMPNQLGQASNNSSVDLNSAGAKAAAAQSALKQAQTSYDSALAGYRAYPDSINKALVDSAEQQLTQARQQLAQSSISSVLGGVGSLVSGAVNAVAGAVSGVVSGITNAVSNTVSGIARAFTPATTQNSGPNALPGGVGALANQVIPGAANTVNTLNTTLSSVTNVAAGNALNPASLVGNLVGGTAKAITGIVGGITNAATGAINGAIGAVTGTIGALGNTVTSIANLPGQILGSVTSSANGILSTLQTALASIGSMSGQIKPPITAQNTFNTMTQTANTGQLLGDSKVPLPPSVSSPPVAPPQPTANLDTQASAKAKAAQAVTDAQEAVDTQKELIAEGFVNEGEDPNSKQAQFYAGLANDELVRRQKTLDDAQAKYQAIVSAENSAPGTDASGPK